MNNLIGIVLFKRTAIKIKPRVVTGKMHTLVCSEGGWTVPGMFLPCRQELPQTLAGGGTKKTGMDCS